MVVQRSKARLVGRCRPVMMFTLDTLMTRLIVRGTKTTTRVSMLKVQVLRGTV